MNVSPEFNLDLNACVKIFDGLFDGVYVVDKERKIRYWNKAAERITGFTSAEMVGKPCQSCGVRRETGNSTDRCKDICGLHNDPYTQNEWEENAFFWHRNGLKIPIHIRMVPICDFNGKVVSTAEIFKKITAEKVVRDRISELEELTFLDPLTKLLNRRGIEMSLQLRIEELARYDWPFGVLFVDIDHFKNVNDTYGHETGDRMLQLISKRLLASMRPFDVLGRWGGEEFLGIVVNVGADELAQVAERARLQVEQTLLPITKGLARATVSIGATTALRTESAMDIIERADRLMYDSKLAGRNRVTIQPGAPK